MSDLSDSEDDTGSADAGGDTSEMESIDSDSDGDTTSDAWTDSENDENGDVSFAQAPWLPIMGDDPGPNPIQFTANPGPKHAPPADAKPIEYAKLFLPDRFVNLIVTEINRYSTQWIDSHQDFLRQKQRSRVHGWIREGNNTTTKEFLAFIGVTINMGLNKKPTLKAYWDSVNTSQSTPWFKGHFLRDRFQLLLKFLHFADNEHVPDHNDVNYKLYKIQPLINYFQEAFLFHYCPEKEVSIDESMVGYKGKTLHLRQYMPNKHHARFGVKLWCLSESESGYTSTFEVLKGAHDPADRGEDGVTYNLVFHLMRSANMLNRGHHLGLDNYFSSAKLFLDLHAEQTTATGTVRSNRRGLPRACLATRLRNREVSERRKGPLLCVAYKDGKNRPVLLSTVAKAGYTDVRNRRGENVREPRVVTIYNKIMGGVDLSDAKLYCYLPERRTLKWTTKVAFALIGRAMVNSYIIYEKNTSDMPKVSRYMYMVKVVEGLAGDYYPKKVVRKRRSKAEIEAARAQPAPQVAPPAQAAGVADAHELKKLSVGKKRNCAGDHDKRVRSGWECPVCDVGLCSGCYVTYHKKPKM